MPGEPARRGDLVGGFVVPFDALEELEELRDVMKLRDEIERELAGEGRVLLRYSGTEPKIRLLIEGREFNKIDKHADRIAEAIQAAIGTS